MKSCPQCRRTESDNSLAFCRVDGTALIEDSLNENSGTIRFDTGSVHSEAETSALPSQLTNPDVRPVQQTTVLSRQVPNENTREFAKRKPWPIIMVLVVVIAVATIAGVYLYSRDKEIKSIDSIAVMPFLNESGNADVEYISDGMTETLIKSLSQLPNLNVKARSTVFRYKGQEHDARTIGNQLNVQAILNGRVVQRGEQLTLSLELIDAQTENVIWSEQYLRKQTDLVTLQSEIARDVSGQLRTKLSGAEEKRVTNTYTTDSAAYQLYLKGRFHWNRRTYSDLQKAIEHFKAAIAKDDRFALAYSGLADTYSIMPYYAGSQSRELNELARPYAIRAVEIDEQLSEAHTSLAFVNEGSWRWAEAEKEYKRSLELNPNYSTGLMRYARFEVRVPGRDVEGLIRIKRAVELEPASLVANDNLSQMYLSQGQVDLAIEQAKRTVELDPSFSFGLLDLAYAQVKKGQHTEALANAEKVINVTQRSTRGLVCLGVVQAMSGRRTEAIAILKELEEKYGKSHSDATEVAALYAGLGDKDQAFVWLDKAFENHSSLLVDLRAEFPFASLRDDRRFTDLRKRMGMPE